MTSVEFLKLCVRRWYVLAIGLVLSVGCAFLAAGPTTVYTSHTTVNVLDPDGGKQRIIGVNSPDAIGVANTLAALVNNGVKTPVASDPDVTLESIGILQGTHAQVRNVGGQWLSQVTEPVVDVQSVAPTPQLALSQLNAEVGRITYEMNNLEDRLKVPVKQRFQLTLNPAQAGVDTVTTWHSRSFVGYFLAGLGLSLCAVWWFERLAVARGPRTARATRGSRTAASAA